MVSGRSVAGAAAAAALALLGLVAVPLMTPPVARADLSLVVVPDQAHAGDSVALSGGCTPGWSSSQTGLRLSAPDLGVDEELEPIQLEEGNTFAGVSRTIPGDVPPGEYTLYTQCDAEAPLTVLPSLPVETSLTVEPTEGPVGSGVTATGTCSESSGSTELVLGGRPVGSPAVDPSTGAFTASFDVPDLDPDTYEVTSDCGGTTTFEVVATPEIPATLALDPASGAAGDSVTATGTCALSHGTVTVYFDDDSVGTEAVDPETGEFVPVEFAVPTHDVGPVTVETDCGAEMTFTVTLPITVTPAPVQPGTPTPGTSTPETSSPDTTTPATPEAPGTPTESSAPPAPTTAVPTVTPDGSRIVVPDLTGMTEDEAVAALGSDLRLRNPTGRDGTIRRQDPPPGTLVEPASAVSVELADESAAASSPWWPAPTVFLALLAGLAAEWARRARRARREERWVEEQVRTATRQHAPQLSAVPDSAVPGWDIRLEVRRDPARL